MPKALRGFCASKILQNASNCLASITNASHHQCIRYLIAPYLPASSTRVSKVHSFERQHPLHSSAIEGASHLSIIAHHEVHERKPFQMKSISLSAALLAIACGTITTPPPEEGIADTDEVTDSTSALAVSCDPQMSLFPVAAEHNIGYDRSCASGTCPISCPDTHANSDWNGPAGHHGIDVFAFRGAPLVAVADGTIVAVGRPSSTSGLRVRLRDDCGWEYYYGHLDSAAVAVGQRVARGTVLGTMGNTGTSGVHLHFNVSPNGRYSSDINPFDLLLSTSPTACEAPPPPPPPPPPPSGCGVLGTGQTLAPDTALTSCDGRFSLVAQSDGNLVLYQTGVGPLWWTGTNGNGPVSLAVQGDGNLVLYANGGAPIWYTWTFGASAALAMQDDGNLVLYHGQRAVWSSQTCCR